MRVIIAGGRNFEDYDALLRAIAASGFEITTVVSGACPTGADRMGERWAAENGIPVERHPADWAKYGKPAGPMRNLEMAKCADALIAMPGERGTASMIQCAYGEGIKVFVASS